jgi:hypothetical protein
MIWNISEDFINPTNKAIQKVSSYRQIIPSTDLSVDDYNLFLVFASPQELENDIITEETYKKIVRNTSWDYL